MKTIMFVHSSSDLYGSDKSLYYLIKNLDAKKFKKIVVLPSNGPLKDKMADLDCEVIIKDFAVLRRKNKSILGLLKYVFDFINSFIFFVKIINHYNVDIVYSNTAVILPSGLASKFKKKKTIWHIREIVKNTKENYILSCYIDSLSDLIIFNSESTKKAFKKNARGRKYKVIYNGVEEFNISQNLKRITTEDEVVIVGMAGRINRWKGHKEFLEMAKIVQSKMNTTKFLIAGETIQGEENLKTELEQLIQENSMTDNVKLLGQVDDMHSFYEKIDIFILPSIQPEPFGLVVIEAMEMSVPVIATNHGGPTEIIEDGVDGFLVSNIDEMVTRVIQLIEDSNLRLKVGQSGQIKKRSLFSIERTCSEIEKLLENLGD